MQVQHKRVKQYYITPRLILVSLLAACIGTFVALQYQGNASVVVEVIIGLVSFAVLMGVYFFVRDLFVITNKGRDPVGWIETRRSRQRRADAHTH